MGIESGRETGRSAPQNGYSLQFAPVLMDAHLISITANLSAKARCNII
jgi:hypothetical protein